MTNPYEILTDALLNGAPVDELSDIVTEGLMNDDAIRETTYLSYLLKFEQFLDSCDIYAFEGWEDGEVIGYPHIRRFWVTVDVLLPKGADISGGMRIIGKNEENRVLVKKEGDGYLVRVKVLRRLLDEIEVQNRRDAAKVKAKDKQA